jgi:hypothetical protein
VIIGQIGMQDTGDILRFPTPGPASLTRHTHCIDSWKSVLLNFIDSSSKDLIDGMQMNK